MSNVLFIEIKEHIGTTRTIAIDQISSINEQGVGTRLVLKEIGDNSKNTEFILTETPYQLKTRITALLARTEK